VSVYRRTWSGVVRTTVECGMQSNGDHSVQQATTDRRWMGVQSNPTMRTADGRCGSESSVDQILSTRSRRVNDCVGLHRFICKSDQRIVYGKSPLKPSYSWNSGKPVVTELASIRLHHEKT